jgi:hypothetical protein
MAQGSQQKVHPCSNQTGKTTKKKQTNDTRQKKADCCSTGQVGDSSSGEMENVKAAGRNRL